MIKQLKTNNKKGFTLVEIIAVLFVISVGLLGVLSLIIQNIQSQNLNKNNIAAYQLAQEGLELVRKVRDTNWVSGPPVQAWDKDLDDGLYYMDFKDSIPQTANSGDGGLYKDANGFYVNTGGIALTNFTRTISIKHLGARSMRVYAHVSWTDRDKTFNYDLETLLYDWR